MPERTPIQYEDDSCELLETEGALAETTKDIIRSFVMQRSGRKKIKIGEGKCKD